MINRLLSVATATALISVFMFDENFAANLSRGPRRGSRDYARSVGGGDWRRSSWVCSPLRPLPGATPMKTWHAVAFLIVTARGRAGEPWVSFFSGVSYIGPTKNNGAQDLTAALDAVLISSEVSHCHSPFRSASSLQLQP